MIAVLSVFTLHLNAATFNPWFYQETNNSHIVSSVLADNEQLYTLTNKNQLNQVLKTDFDGGVEVLFSETGDAFNRNSQLFELHSQILLAAKTGDMIENVQLFSTDGSTMFQAISEPFPYLSETITNGLYFVQKADLTFLWTDGQSINSFNQLRKVIPLCAFNKDYFVFGVDYGDKYRIRIYNQGAIETPFPQFEFFSDNQISQTNQACMVSASDDGGKKTTLYFSQQESRNLNEQFEYLTASEAVFYVLDSATGFNGPSPLRQLTEDSLETLNTFSVPSRASEVVDIKANQNQVILSVTESLGSEFNRVYFMDNQLNTLSNDLIVAKGSEIFSNAAHDFILYDGQLKVFSDGSLKHEFTLNQQLTHHIVTNDSSEQLLLTSNLEESTNTLAAFLFKSKPAVGEQMAGTWVDTSLRNQGVSISPGIRQDGSRYIFLTLFTFKDNQPHWLAGTYDYTSNESEALIDLFEFEGAGFIDAETTPSGKLFGTLRLSFESCNVMNGALNHDNNTVSLELNRIDDTSYGLLCVD